jgi:hypothetical protein
VEFADGPAMEAGLTGHAEKLKDVVLKVDITPCPLLGSYLVIIAKVLTPFAARLPSSLARSSSPIRPAIPSLAPSVEAACEEAEEVEAEVTGGMGPEVV